MRARVVVGMLAALLACAGLQQQQYEVRRADLSCDEANRYAFRTMRNMGVDVTRFDPASEGRTGTIRGTRTNEAGRVQDVGADIACRPGEVFVSASENRVLKQDVTFARGFFLGFTGLADHAEAGAAYAQTVSGGTEGGGVKFKIQPQIALESKLDFGEDLAAGGVLAVRVAVQNGSDRTYDLDPSAIELRPAEGRGKVEQLPIAKASADVAKAAAAALDAGAARPDTAAIEKTLRERALKAQKLAPGSETEGFLYFPTGKYARARATLVDVETKESEGFMVEF